MDKITINKINSADARSKLRDLIDDVAFGNHHKILMRNEKPMAALISMKDYKRLMDLEDFALGEMARHAENDKDLDFFEVMRGKNVSGKDKVSSGKAAKKSAKKSSRRLR